MDRSGAIVPDKHPRHVSGIVPYDSNEHIKTVLSDESLDLFERDRRIALLRDIEERVRQDGAHAAQSHDDRARQFMPFAALKGYHDLVHEREQVRVAQRDVTDEQARALSHSLSRLSKGDATNITHYEDGKYLTTCGTVLEVNETLRTMSIGGRDISFDDIVAIDPRDKDEA